MSGWTRRHSRPSQPPLKRWNEGALEQGLVRGVLFADRIAARDEDPDELERLSRYRDPLLLCQVRSQLAQGRRAAPLTWADYEPQYKAQAQVYS